ncbi:beta-ketoacyl-ACP synthase III [Streptomyces sp. V4-01]|uniref:Beta-ketoacyl-[acyl-carrier-protein] synthase III n=1 Tax=Actinacidiphila polyblastidii TaxID=3110430 RepID=A0ABU7P9K0_9ACTN|nr:beta-ketoacyl-ACP synthase III [Streptomyces sp. V4-01]
MSRAAVVAGLGAWTPPTLVTNDDLAARLDTDDEWIRTRTGIRQRHVVGPGQATSDLAVEAGRRALASAGVERAGLLVVATSTPDQPLPATAPQVADRLGLGTVPAFDVSAVCTGFVYALATAAGLIATGVADTALVIGADAFSTILDPADRATRVLFGDGAGAVLLRAGSPDEPGALDGVHLGSDGSQHRLIERPGGGSRTGAALAAAAGGQLNGQLLAAGDADGHAAAHDGYLTMQGRAVFAQAVQRTAETVRATAERLRWPLEAIDRLVLHQANARISAAVGQRLGTPADRLVSNIDRVGNTAAASIPLVLADAAAAGDLRPGHRVVLAGFGGGLTWGSVGLVWPRLRGGPIPAAGPSDSPTL